MRNKERYHQDWNDIIRPEILKRDKYRCTKCGAEHKQAYVFDEDGSKHKIPDNEIKEWKKYGDKAYKVFLQIAHLDHDPNNNNYSNLASMCVKCHLKNDTQHRIMARIVKFK